MMSLDQLVAVLWRRWRTFLAVFVLVMAGAVAATVLMPKVYTTTAYLYVSSGGESVSDFESVQVNQVVTKTYSELLQTRDVADAVAERLPNALDGEQLLGRIEVAPVTQSQLITVTASGSSPQRAQEIANAFADTFIERLPSFAGSAGGAEVSLAAPAPLVETPSRPRPMLYLLVGAIVAALVAAGAALLRHRLDQRVDLGPAASEVLGTPIIARIPKAAAAAHDVAVPGERVDDDDRHLAESFRLALANLTFANQGTRPRTLAIVSATRGEGKSTTCIALARAAVETGSKTLLVDGDLRRPRLSAELGAGPDQGLPGFSTFLLGNRPLSVVDVAVELTDLGFDLVPSGPLPPSPASLLGSRALADFVARAERVYDLVIIDTPPLSVGADASLVAATTEGALIVVDAPASRRTTLGHAVEQLQRTHATIFGVLVNRGEETVDGSYYGGIGPHEDGHRPRRASRTSRSSRSSRSESLTGGGRG